MSRPAGDPPAEARPPVEGRPPVEVVEQELVLLFRRARAVFEQTAREVHPGLDVSAYGLLFLIDTGEATTVTALSGRLGVGKPTVSRQVSALEKLGLVSRSGSEDDRRAVRLALTAEGGTRLGQARARRQEGFRTMLAQWDPADVAALGDLLHRFNQLAG